MKKCIHTEMAPKAIGPYSQGVVSDNLIFTSGQLGVHPKSNQLQFGVAAQTEQALNNIEQILIEAGTKLEHVLKMTVFLKDLEDFELVNDIYQSYFEKNPPARSCVQVAKLPLDALVEIECIAAIKG